MQIKLLGTGGSMGIPVVGCTCKTCASTNPRDQRLRSGALLTIGDQKIMIDIGPDFRQQALNNEIDHLDALFLTHLHHDHTAGLDELRPFFFHRNIPLPCYLSTETLNSLIERFRYIFEPDGRAAILPKLETLILPERGEIEFCGATWKIFSYSQMTVQVHGFRVGGLAYVTDIKEYPETIFEDLEGADVLILGALRHKATDIHFSIEEAVAFAKKAKAKQTYLVHLAHEVMWETTKLPKGIDLAYDGLIIDL